MAQISGIPVENITTMRGVNATSVVSIGGISTSSIPGWPSGSGCETLILGYASGPPPTQACRNRTNEYQFDSTNSILYGVGELCGGTTAPNGFYSDGITVYSWFGGMWGVGGPC
jgi:hypothetical protein